MAFASNRLCFVRVSEVRSERRCVGEVKSIQYHRNDWAEKQNATQDGKSLSKVTAPSLLQIEGQ
jgi:hypothetical protein